MRSGTKILVTDLHHLHMLVDVERDLAAALVLLEPRQIGAVGEAGGNTAGADRGRQVMGVVIDALAVAALQVAVGVVGEARAAAADPGDRGHRIGAARVVGITAGVVVL
jgi:hypothetical protein